MEEVILKQAEKDKFVPEDFYSTTNMPTTICLDGRELLVQNQRMDAMIVVKDGKAFATKLRDIKKGDLVVCTEQGVEVDRDYDSLGDKEDFGFMSNTVSSERRNELIIQDLARDLRSGKKLTIVAGPVVVHTGGDKYLAQLIKEGYIRAILGGNAVAVHDMEKSFYNTSLGVDASTGRPVENGYMNHMRAINRIWGHGSIEKAVKNGDLKTGIMYQCIKNDIDFVLAGSLRDDGPLPDTITDMVEAQNQYGKILGEADIVVIMGTMLHGIASGNMMAAKTPMICVDISPSTVTKLSDRGSGQSQGVVTDVGLFLKLLYLELKTL